MRVNRPRTDRDSLNPRKATRLYACAMLAVAACSPAVTADPDRTSPASHVRELTAEQQITHTVGVDGGYTHFASAIAARHLGATKLGRIFPGYEGSTLERLSMLRA